MDQASYSTNRKQGQFAINILTGGDAKWDIDFTLSKYDPKSKSNYYGVNDPELTKLVEAQRAEVDPAKRREIVRQAGRLIAERAYGTALYHLVTYYFWQPYVKNYQPNWNKDGFPLTNVWLEK